MLLDYCRKHPHETEIWRLEDTLEDQGLLHRLRLNTPFYHQYEDVAVIRTRASNVDPGPKIMYLSSATLIVVPANLLSQWVGEIHKHCKETLRVLVVNEDVQISHASDLATNYDVSGPILSLHRCTHVLEDRSDELPSYVIYSHLCRILKKPM